MGKSAKLHKRMSKKLKLSNQPSSYASISTQNLVQNAQKRASRKGKAAALKGNKGGGPILGGADYVALMIGGRRKAQEEATKLPQDQDDS